MFWRRRRYERDALVFMSMMTEQQKIETRCMSVLSLAMQKVQVHVMTATQESATRHASHIARIGEELRVEVAQLPVGGPESARAAVYQASVVVGPMSEFMSGYDRGLRAEGAVALVEGEPPKAARAMLSGYASVRLS
jgi:preprotein translocase subunit SecA